MKLFASSALAITIAATFASPALAASDYYLKIGGVDGETSATIEVLSWSWGASNVTAPRDVATGQASGKRQHEPVKVEIPHSQSLRESPTRASTGKTAVASTAPPKANWDLGTNKGARVAAGDLDGDGRADLAVAAAHDEIQGFSLTLDKSSPILARMCATGQHIKDATLMRQGAVVYELKDVSVSSCDITSQPAPESTASTSSASTRQKMWLTSNFRGPNLGARCTSGQCVTMAMTGQMKHTSTGHVTLMK